MLCKIIVIQGVNLQLAWSGLKAMISWTSGLMVRAPQEGLMGAWLSLTQTMLDSLNVFRILISLVFTKNTVVKFLWLTSL